MFTLLYQLATHLVQCEEGFILQGLQVDLKQTGQVLRTKTRKKQMKVREENLKENSEHVRPLKSL